MKILSKKSKGFTLVELAIVITIIGLLIGGVLKGQELLQNARMTSGAAKLKGIVAATITFKDIYKALPGDMANPASFIQNCTTAPCNVNGDANGQIGTDDSVYGQENARYWLHLAKAGLISGVNPNATWTGANTFDSSYPVFDMGGMVTIWHANVTPNTNYPDGLQNHQLFPLIRASSTDVAPTLPHNLIGKYDLKVDDGKPYHGDVRIYGVCGVSAGAVAYNPNESAACYLISNVGF